MGINKSLDRGVLILRLANPPVNALSTELRTELRDALEEAERDSGVAAIVFAGDGAHFCGGADIRGFGKPPESPSLPELIATIERSAKRFYAAIDGSAFGGGLEIALACDARYGTRGASVALPEINLGLLPGAGGTQRLPRVAGVAKAIDTIVSGKPLAAEQAVQAGILDGIVEGDVVAAVADIARGEAGRERRRVSALAVTADDGAIDVARARLAPISRGGLAAQRALDAIEAASSMSFDAGLARERELFMELLASEQSRSRIHAFFAEREAAKIPDVPASVQPRAIARACIIGAGTMGGGIAMALADAGLTVHVVESSVDAIARGRGIIEKHYAASASKGRITARDADERLQHLHFGTDLEAAAAQAELVIEAVFEDLDVKREVFLRLDRACAPGTLLATNTSTIDIDAIASATARPQDVIGLHFFSPANVMRLLEIVRGTRTSASAIATAFALAKRIKKVGVLARSCDGFIGNRMLVGYRREANYLIEEGALPQDVDRAIKAFGFPMGPFAMADLAGLDIGWRIKLRRKAEGRLGAYRDSEIVDRLCEQGHFGQKTGRGIYRYEPGNRTPQTDPEVEALIRSESERLGIARRAISDDEIVTRALLPLVNEGANILSDGTAIRPGDIDVVWMQGYGFPAWRGGPMHWADTLGVRNVRDDMRRLQKIHGDQWQPSALIEELAASGKSFADYRVQQSAVRA